MWKSTITAVFAGVIGLVGSAAHAQQGPAVRLMVGYAPGGAVDTVARALAERLRGALDQNVIVDNKPGANQRLALGEIKRARPDGLTLILSNNAPFTLFPHAFSRLEFDPVKDFTPIGRVATFDLCIAAGPKAPVGGVKELIIWAKDNPREAVFATSGAGNPGHFVGLMLSKAAGVDFVHVPYKGGAPALTDLAGGQVPIAVDTILEPLEMAKAGKVRILATTGSKRTAVLPNVPTLRESGLDVVAEGYLAVYGPASMPTDKVQRINAALKDVLQSTDLQKRIAQAAMVPAYSTPAELVKAQADGLAAWEQPVKASGFKAD
jgi:tripartite-type tricarboxylate transporter receptor subunit TctC